MKHHKVDCCDCDSQNETSNSTSETKASPISFLGVGHASFEWAQFMKIESHHYPSCTSTNSLAKETKFEVPMALLITDHQTTGRGQRENVWEDSGEGQLLCSWIFQMSFPPQPELCLMLGLATYRALSSTWPYLNWSLKEPNDLLLNSKKVGGILLESLSQGAHHTLIFGLGLNVTSHPHHLSEATHILSHLEDEAQELSTLDWHSFLDRLFLEITQTMVNQNNGKRFQKSLRLACSK